MLLPSRIKLLLKVVYKSSLGYYLESFIVLISNLGVFLEFSYIVSYRGPLVKVLDYSNYIVNILFKIV